MAFCVTFCFSHLYSFVFFQYFFWSFFWTNHKFILFFSSVNGLLVFVLQNFLGIEKFIYFFFSMLRQNGRCSIIFFLFCCIHTIYTYAKHIKRIYYIFNNSRPCFSSAMYTYIAFEHMNWNSWLIRNLFCVYYFYIFFVF